MRISVATLLNSSMSKLDWDFEQLSESDKTIVGNQTTLDGIRKVVESTLKSTINK